MTSYNDEVELTLDHIEAYSNGGPDTFGNLATACRSCNEGKGDRELDASVMKEIEATVFERNQKSGYHGDREIKIPRRLLIGRD